MPSVDASALIVLLETNPKTWNIQSLRCGASYILDTILRQLFVFINAFVSLNEQNRIILIAMHCDGCHYLYESPEFVATDDRVENLSCSASFAEPIQEDACSQIIMALSKLTHHSTADTPLATALSIAMCYSNRCRQRTAATAGLTRVLCIKGSSDTSSQYIPTMNAICSAQRSGIPIDSCILGKVDSAFLQQAAQITGGSYFKPDAFRICLQNLLTMSISDQRSRALLQLPNQRGVDFRTSCFCHKQPLDTGFVCSICLSVFCDENIICPTCGADIHAIA